MRGTELAPVAVALVVAGLAVPVGAHRIAPASIREVVWLEGRVRRAEQALRAERVVTLRLLGEERSLEVLDWRVLSPLGGGGAEPAPPARLDLAGDRYALARVLAARGGRVTILAERRPGATSLFLVAVDACGCEESPEAADAVPAK